MNRLVRERRREVEAFLLAAAILRDAQFAGKGDLQAATKDEREALVRKRDWPVANVTRIRNTR